MTVRPVGRSVVQLAGLIHLWPAAADAMMVYRSMPGCVCAPGHLLSVAEGRSSLLEALILYLCTASSLCQLLAPAPLSTHSFTPCCGQQYGVFKGFRSSFPWLSHLPFSSFTLPLPFPYLITLRASCGAAYCNRSCLFVGVCCGWVGLLPR